MKTKLTLGILAFVIASAPGIAANWQLWQFAKMQRETSAQMTSLYEQVASAKSAELDAYAERMKERDKLITEKVSGHESQTARISAAVKALENLARSVPDSDCIRHPVPAPVNRLFTVGAEKATGGSVRADLPEAWGIGPFLNRTGME